ncbi:MAG TPA: glycyl-radical enzyme activating protein [Anaerovoracaceae bacterium]|nr:glycyl-radical enzyme activating protein [Anaerovoracaceae bacterium]
MMGYVSNIQKFSVNDGYGIRTIVFLLGCTLKCKWCQNPETLENKPTLMFVADLCKGCNRCRKICPNGGPQASENGCVVLNRSQCISCFECADACPYEALKLSGREMSAEQVLNEVMKDKVFYQQSGGGVTISGGEPLMQVDFIAEILKLVKEGGIGTCIETAGNVPWANFEKVLPYTDLFLFDVKFLDPELHKKWTGCSNQLIQENLEKLVKFDKEIIIRIPLIPDINDGQEFKDIIDRISEMENMKEIHILPFHQLGSSKYDQMGMDYSMKDYREDNDEMVRECGQYTAAKGFRVSVGGSGF